MPEMIVRIGSRELMQSLGLQSVVRNLRAEFAEHSNGIIPDKSSIEMEVHFNEGWDENVDPLKITISMTSRESEAKSYHRPWRGSFAETVCSMIEREGIAHLISSIEIEIRVGGKASGAVYPVRGPIAGPEWIDPWFDPPEVVTLS